MSSIPKFFITTPSFNQARFVKQTIESVLMQKGNFELDYWVFDGGSTDGTIEILKSFGNRIKWISEKDHGQSDAINKAMSLFNKQQYGDKTYFAFINSDDYYLPNAFQNVADAFKDHANKSWLVGDARIVDENGKEIQSYIRNYKRLFRNPILKSALWILNYIPQPSTFIKMNMINEVGLFNLNLRYAFDYEYWLRLIKLSGYPVFYPDSLSAFRIHGASKGGTAFISQFNEETKVLKDFNITLGLQILHEGHSHLIQSVYKIIKRDLSAK